MPNIFPLFKKSKQYGKSKAFIDSHPAPWIPQVVITVNSMLQVIIPLTVTKHAHFFTNV